MHECFKSDLFRLANSTTSQPTTAVHHHITSARSTAMRRAAVVVAALLHALGVSCQQGPPAFNVTAISAKDQASRLECWQLDAEPDLSRAAVNYDLGDFKDGFVGILPPRTTSSDGTLSNAASVQ